MRRTVCNVMKAAVILASHTDVLMGLSRIPALQSKRKSVWEATVLQMELFCLRGRNAGWDYTSDGFNTCSCLGHLLMQVAVSDRRWQFDGWNVDFINCIRPFDLGFHSLCNNQAQIKINSTAQDFIITLIKIEMILLVARMEITH